MSSITRKNAKKLYYQPFNNERTFIQKLNISANDDNMLLDARSKTRSAIRLAFKEIPPISSVHLLNNLERQLLNSVKPQFFTQGSYAYKTLNSPGQQGQQIDLDDGVYLPMALFNKELFNPHNIRMIDVFFGIVDYALIKLCETEPNWTFKRHPKCARIELSPRAHIDVPLYAIPDNTHQEMLAFNVQKSITMDSINERYREFASLDSSTVNLATRNNGWLQSDPMVLHKWFVDENAAKGDNRLRRMSRYLKAWRDRTWLNGGPSSIALMICAAAAYPDDDQGRDDYTLLKILEQLPERLEEVINPSDDKREVIYRSNDHPEDLAIQHANTFYHNINQAINGPINIMNSVDTQIASFGSRFPRRTDWMSWIDEMSKSDLIINEPPINDNDRVIPNSVKSA